MENDVETLKLDEVAIENRIKPLVSQQGWVALLEFGPEHLEVVTVPHSVVLDHSLDRVEEFTQVVACKLV